MLRRRAEFSVRASWATVAAPTVAALVCVALIAIGPADRFNSLSLIVGFGAALAGLLVVGENGSLSVSGSYIVEILAAAFLGPASAVAVVIIAELAATIRVKTVWRDTLCINLPSAVVPAAVAALVIHALAGPAHDGLGFYLAVIFAGALALALNFTLWVPLRRLVSPEQEQVGFRTLLEFAPTGGLSLLLAIAGVGINFEVGNAGIAFALAGVCAFSYMAHLVEVSRQRAQQYASLSWGVLAGLMRALDIRDERTARHSAAVARFARDIAREVGMSETEQELAHTAGLLHDIGRFALSDRVAERGRTLTEEDWTAIQRHPELGADMLRDLGVYGPVAEIVLCHHERVDGRGYPRELGPEEIPEIAKVIAVAEVYDTLTATDTYRTQMSSFEALRELRRVAGSQLDERYVEVLAGLFTGEGLAYRHADAADFDSELSMERRIREASAGG